MRSDVASRAFALVLAACAAASAHGVTLPPGFSDSLVTPVGAPTALAFTPDARLLITTQGGTLRVYQSGSLLPTAALTLGSRVCSNSERGLLGVAVDPAFATNHHIYLYYTFNSPTNGCVNRVSRFTLPDTNVIDSGTELVLIDNVPSFAGNHNAGDVHFGADGYLYVSIGDGGCDFTGATGCGGANQASRLRYWLGGKIIRIAADGSIPPTNPFQGAGTARCNTGNASPGMICRETFAWGFRNPFRFAFRPGTSQFYVNDVGQDAWEEIDTAQVGADYGWNCREGAHTNSSTGRCSPTPPNMVDPIFNYAHGATVPGTSSSGCNSITGGAFVPNGIWPASYDGTYLFSDFICGSIFVLSAGAPHSASDFATGLGGGTVVTLAFGPNGASQALYYTTYANGGEVHRIAFAGPTSAAASFFTLTPCRIVDTRDSVGTWGGPALAAGASRDFPLAGRCGIPNDVVAISANVTVADALAGGSVALAPTGTPSGLTTIDFPAGVNRANNAVLGLFGVPAGSVTATANLPSGTVNLIVDVNGYFR